MARRTPLYERHARSGARLVDFGGWDMPLHYGSQINEHHAVRNACGVFDVSHMRVIDVSGEDAPRFLQSVLANDVARLSRPGQALYSCMLNPAGGVIDDLIVYSRDTGYRLVVNAGTADDDFDWLAGHGSPLNVQLVQRSDFAILAIQGPHALRTVDLFAGHHAEAVRALKPFECAELGDGFCGRTGYTGEDGFEVMVPAESVDALWERLTDAGVVACGLGCRDTLRLEAGMNLYGQDMDASTSPLEAGLAWTVALSDERAFIGRSALEALRQKGIPLRQVGLILDDPGVLRSHMTVSTDAGTGTTTSGTFSPTLGKSIALARIPFATQSTAVTVEIRGKALRARIVKTPFVRNGEILVEV